jgi:uncharacterized protein
MIITDLKTKLYEAQKARDTLRMGVLRYLLSQLQNKEIELRPQGKELDDEITLKVIDKQIKQREEAIEEFRKAGREDLVNKEASELEVLKEYREDLG